MKARGTKSRHRLEKFYEVEGIEAPPEEERNAYARALFRAAGAELVELPTPPKVAINEYVDVAKAFFPEGKESKFVNAVLDHMAHEARPEAF